MYPIHLVKSEDSIYQIKISDSVISLNVFIVILCGLLIGIATVYLKPYRFDIAIMPILMSLVAAYNIHCVEVGHCGSWSLILTGLYLINAITVIYVIYKLKNNPIGFKSDMTNALTYYQSKLNRLV
jgi:hypothetical protein